MDPPRKPTTHLKPPPHHTPRPTSTTTSTTSGTPAPPRAPVTAHPSATIAESTIIQGTHPVSIGAGTVIHPRTRIYSFQGPVIIEEACIIGEKSVIGTVPPSASTSTSTSASSWATNSKENEESALPITLSASVTLGPGVTIHPGTRLQTGVLIEALCTIHRRATIGAHSKVCAGCEVAENTALPDWMVVWGTTAGTGQQRRRVRAKGRMSSATAAQQGVQALEAGVIEEARLMVLRKEREALARLIGASAASSGRRR